MIKKKSTNTLFKQSFGILILPQKLFLLGTPNDINIEFRFALQGDYNHQELFLMQACDVVQ